MAYGNDALRRQVEILIRADADPLRTLNDQLAMATARLEETTQAGLASGRAWSEISKETASARAAVNATARALDELKRQLDATAGAAAPAAQAHQDATQKIDVSWSQLVQAGFKYSDQILKQQQKAAADGAKAHQDAAARIAAAQQQGAAQQRAALESTLVPIGALIQSGFHLQERLGGAGASAANFGRQMLFVSYAMQDLYQGGFSAVLNNIPQLAYAFGVNQAAAGGLAIAALGVDVAFKTLGPSARDLARDLGLIDAKTEAQELDELAKATARTVEQQERLNFEKERESNIKAQQAGRTDEEKDQQKAVNEALIGKDREHAILGLADTSADQLEAISPDAAAAGDKARERAEVLKNTSMPGGGFRPRTDEEYARALESDPFLKELQANYRDKLKAAAERMMGEAAQTPGALGLLLARVQAAPSAFPAGLAGKLAAATPEGMAQSKAIDEAAAAREADDENYKANKAMRESRRKLAEKAEDEDPHDAFNQAQADNEFWLTVGKPRREAREKAEKKAAKAEARDDAKADRVAEAAAKKLGPGFEARVQAEILENRRRTAAGNVVASTPAEFDMYRQMGQAPAMTPELQSANLSQRIGFDLRRAGVDPALAPRVVEQADSKLGPMIAATSARMGATMDSLVDSQTILGQVQAQVNANMARIDARTRSFQTQMRAAHGRGGGSQIPFQVQPFTPGVTQ